MGSCLHQAQSEYSRQDHHLQPTRLESPEQWYRLTDRSVSMMYSYRHFHLRLPMLEE